MPVQYTCPAESIGHTHGPQRRVRSCKPTPGPKRLHRRQTNQTQHQRVMRLQSILKETETHLWLSTIPSSAQSVSAEARRRLPNITKAERSKPRQKTTHYKSRMTQTHGRTASSAFRSTTCCCEVQTLPQRRSSGPAGAGLVENHPALALAHSKE